MSTTTYQSGDFSFLKSINDIMMLTDAYKAVSQTESWDLLKEEPGDGGFMFSNDPRMNTLNSAIKYTGHSGGSYGYTMRHMQYIARNGWTAYCDHIISSQETPY
jgi:hypothetical protein